tara:strand:- start:15399 stop:15617 length:219 start_codon:yes stop_codon:yes gene_type:complete
MIPLETNLTGAYSHQDLFTTLDLSVKRLKEELKQLSTRDLLYFRIEGVGNGLGLRIACEAEKPEKIDEGGLH